MFSLRNQNCIAKPSFFIVFSPCNRICVAKPLFFIVFSHCNRICVAKPLFFRWVSHQNRSCIAKPLFFHRVFSLEPFKPPLVHWILQNIWKWPWTFGVSIPIVKTFFVCLGNGSGKPWGVLGVPKGSTRIFLEFSRAPHSAAPPVTLDPDNLSESNLMASLRWIKPYYNVCFLKSKLHS